MGVVIPAERFMGEGVYRAVCPICSSRLALRIRTPEILGATPKADDDTQSHDHGKPIFRWGSTVLVSSTDVQES